MNDLDNNNFIGINICPILTGNCFLCIFSIIANIIEIKIILSLKFLHSILYRLLFIIAISEIINCSFHMIQSIFIIFDINFSFLYNLDSFVLYYTDTLTVVLLSCLCDSMNALILKQNRKISTNQTYKIFSLIFASVLTIIYFILYIVNINDNHIYSDVISWKFISNENIQTIKLFSASFISYGFTLIIYILLVMYCFYMIIKINLFIGEKSQDESKSKNWIKLKEFKYKMLQYPFFGAIWVGPLAIYSLLEVIKLNNKDTNISEKSNILKIKYFLFFVFTFISSVRGLLFFKLFISNEKIKKYIQYKIKYVIFFQNVLKDEISELIEKSQSENDTSIFSIKSGDTENKFGIFQEGLIDDRDDNNDKKNGSDSDSNSEEEENISDKQEKDSKANTMPFKKNISSLSSLSGDKDEINHNKKNSSINSNYV